MLQCTNFVRKVLQKPNIGSSRTCCQLHLTTTWSIHEPLTKEDRHMSIQVTVLKPTLVDLKHASCQELNEDIVRSIKHPDRIHILYCRWWWQYRGCDNPGICVCDMRTMGQIPGLWLVQSNHVTLILASHWLRISQSQEWSQLLSCYSGTRRHGDMLSGQHH